LKLLFDQNLSPSLVETLREIFPESLHVQSAGLSRAGDEEVWHYAKEHGFVVVTKDSDFHERTLLAGGPPKVVWIRRANCSTAEIAAILSRHAEDMRALERDEQALFLILV